MINKSGKKGAEQKQMDEESLSESEKTPEPEKSKPLRFPGDHARQALMQRMNSASKPKSRSKHKSRSKTRSATKPKSKKKSRKKTKRSRSMTPVQLYARNHRKGNVDSAPHRLQESLNTPQYVHPTPTTPLADGSEPEYDHSDVKLFAGNLLDLVTGNAPFGNPPPGGKPLDFMLPYSSPLEHLVKGEIRPIYKKKRKSKKVTKDDKEESSESGSNWECSSPSGSSESSSFGLDTDMSEPESESESDWEDEKPRRRRAPSSSSKPRSQKPRLHDSNRVSCHQCKRNTPPSQMLYCANKIANKSSGRACNKKFCVLCMERYCSSMTEVQKVQRDTRAVIRETSCWCCPACKGECSCAACLRKAKNGGRTETGPVKRKKYGKRKGAGSPEPDDLPEVKRERRTR